LTRHKKYYDKIKGIKKSLYYASIPVFILNFLLIVAMMGVFIVITMANNVAKVNEIGISYLFFFVITILTVFAELPYLQAIIVLILRKVNKNIKNGETKEEKTSTYE
jgi:hypothetical protein